MINLSVIQKGFIRYPAWTIGKYGNAWDNEKTGVGGFSKIIRTYGMPFLSIMGEIDAASTISFYASQDGEHFYFCNVITTSIVPASPPAPAWATGIAYAVGDQVTVAAQKYRCILAHTSNPSRVPPDATYWETVIDTYPKQFHIYPVVGAEYVRLRSSADVTITATIAGKAGE